MTQHKEQVMNLVLFEGIKDMIYVMQVRDSDEFVYYFINHAVEELAGFTREIIGRSLDEILDLPKAVFLAKKYREAVVTKNCVIYEDIFPSPCGETRYGENSLTPIFDDEGNCTHVVAVVKDITERKMAEKAAIRARESLVEGKQRYQSLFDYNLDAVMAIDRDGMITAGNRSLSVMTGYSKNEVDGVHFLALIDPEDHEVAKQYFDVALSGLLEEFSTRMLSKAGKYIETIWKFTPIIVRNETVGIYAICKDLTEQIRMQNKYTESENKFEIIAENSGDLITMLDRDGKITYVSPSYRDVLIVDPDEYIGKEFYHNVHPDDINELLESFEQSKATGKHWMAQFRQKHQTLGWIWSELRGSPVYNNRKEFKQMVVLSRDISMRKNYEDKLKYFAYHDSLTGIPNRRLFTMKLKEALEDYENGSGKFAVIIMDLDRFKKINDTFGHDIGDRAIAEFAVRIGKLIRATDTLARLGGDEFVLLLNNTSSIQEVTVFAEKILETVNKPWHIGEAAFVTTASVGISLLSHDKTNTYETLLKNADQALYEAKNAGGNGYSIKM